MELGGTDQRFNLLAGRTIQKLYGQESQDILTTVLMEGTDGRKMSSSWGNVINIIDEPKEMFGKVMSINDDLIKKYFILATRVPLSEVDEIINSHSNPRDQKLILAEKLTALYHGQKLASEAKENFISQFSNKKLPENIETIALPLKMEVADKILVEAKAVASRSEARRLIEQGGVNVDGAAVKPGDKIELTDKPKIFKIGKRKYIKIIKKK